MNIVYLPQGCIALFKNFMEGSDETEATGQAF